MVYYTIIIQNPLRITQSFATAKDIIQSPCVKGVREVDDLGHWIDTAEDISKNICGTADTVQGTIGIRIK